MEELGRARKQARSQRATGVPETTTHSPHCEKPLTID